jgi:hypothetical protein
MALRFRTFPMIVSIGVAAALCVGAGWATFAASSPGVTQAPAEPDKQTFTRQTRNDPRDDASTRLEGRLAYLKDSLKITPQQDALWDNYAETLRKAQGNRVRPQDTSPSSAEKTPPNLVEQLDTRRKIMEAATARMVQTEDATKALYAGLTDEQKRIADRLLAPRSTGGLRARRSFDERYDGTRPL